MDMMNLRSDPEGCASEQPVTVAQRTEYTNGFNDFDLDQVLAMCADLQRRLDLLLLRT